MRTVASASLIQSEMYACPSLNNPTFPNDTVLVERCPGRFCRKPFWICRREESSNLLLLSKRKHAIIPFGNLKVDSHEGKAGRLARNARADGPQDSGCHGTAARVRYRPAHRADQRRPSGCQPGYALSPAAQARA